jgi:hypothetical protein
MARDKPKIAATVIRMNSTLASRAAKQFAERVQVFANMGLAREGLQALAKTREGYDLRLAVDGPNMKPGDGTASIKEDMFLLSAETGKRITTDDYGYLARIEDGDVDGALQELLQKLKESHALRRIAAAVLKDAEDQAGAKKTKN